MTITIIHNLSNYLRLIAINYDDMRLLMTITINDVDSVTCYINR